MKPQAGRSFYEILGIPPNAQKQDIRNAYRRLALRYHPDKNQGDSSAKATFQEIQAAYETLSEDDKRAKYDITAGFSQSSRSTRPWREPSYGSCPTYTQDPPFWSVELRAMTIQKCARITRIQHLEREIRESILTHEDLVAAEDKAAAKETKARNRFPSLFTHSRASKQNAQRRHDFLAQSAQINAHLDSIKTELRTAIEEHRILLERDNERKIWWARERVRRVEEENRRAATTAAEAEAARRRAEREHRDRETRAADDEGEDTAGKARAARAEAEKRKRERVDPDMVRRREREAREWVARQRMADHSCMGEEG